jgi:hypothetical protein
MILLAGGSYLAYKIEINANTRDFTKIRAITSPLLFIQGE